VHELGIANSIMEMVLDEMSKKNLTIVNKIVLELGVLTDIVPDTLDFNFEIITKDTALANTKLEIKHIPLRACCEKCSVEFEVENFFFACPACHSRQVRVTQGEELNVAYLEVPENQNGNGLPVSR